MAKEKLTEADKKFIAKFFGEIDFDATEIKRSNPCTSVAIAVDPVFAKCFDFVMKVQSVLGITNDAVLSYELQKIHADLKQTNAIQNFDRARMIALKMDTRAYMELLD